MDRAGDDTAPGACRRLPARGRRAAGIEGSGNSSRGVWRRRGMGAPREAWDGQAVPGTEKGAAAPCGTWTTGAAGRRDREIRVEALRSAASSGCGPPPVSVRHLHPSPSPRARIPAAAGGALCIPPPAAASGAGAPAGGVAATPPLPDPSIPQGAGPRQPDSP